MAKRRRGHRARSGRLSRAFRGPARDDGTPELQAKRIALVGETPGPDSKPPDPALSVTMPGILLARGVLTREQFEAADRFRQLRCALYGPPWPANSVPLGYGPSDHKLIWMACDFDRMVEVLTPAQRQILQAVCVFDMRPTVLESPDLLAGLDALVAQSDRRCRRCQDMARCSRRRRAA